MTDVNVAVLVIFAITSMGIYGIVLAGWSSNSKYSLLGGLRSSAQMISYELSYGLALAAVIMLAGSLSLREIVMNQSGTWWGFIPRWYIFLQPLGFLIYMTAGVAETNRAPFDFPEAEQELVAGYHTEYSSMSFAMFFLAEYVNMVTVSAVATSLYLGGWLGPFLPSWLGWIWFLVKVFLLLFFYVWMRWTLPRYRYDQLMEFGWKWLLPAAVLNLLATAALVLWLDEADYAGRSESAFYVFAAIAVLASLGVVGQRNPMHSVMLLIVSFGALAGLYVLLDAPFTAVTQIIIYAGAIMVLFLFVVMLLNVPREEPAPPSLSATARADGHASRRACSRCCWRVEIVWALSRVGAARSRPGQAGVGQLGGQHRPGALHEARVRVRSDLDPDSGGDGRRGRPRAEGTSLMVPLNYYLVLSGVLFAIGTAGVFLRRNLITVLLSIEIMLNAVNLTFVAVGRYLGTSTGRSSCSSS